MSSTGAAQTTEQMSFEATGTDGAAALRQAASERLAAHRRRRAAERAREEELEAEAQARVARKRMGASKVRDAVAARYQNSVSYREFLAQEAERALQQAQAEAEVAARKAQAVAEAQMQLLAEMEQWDEPQPSPREAALAQHAAETRDELAHAVADIAVAATAALHLEPRVEFAPAPERAAGGFRVKLMDEIAAKRSVAEARPRVTLVESDDTEATLDEEIAFRMAPEFEPPAPEPIALIGNVIEFPRQLVAARKARPRLAEGPLREDGTPQPQLRIFEVEPEQISVAPEIEEDSAPEWQSLLLGAAAATEAKPASGMQIVAAAQPDTARTSLRVMAGAVDACCIGTALLGFAAVVVEVSGMSLRALPLPMAGASAALTLGIFYMLYQMMFFSLNDQTPGMRYARIALCTFTDESPSRKAMRRRVGAKLLAACPLGLGLIWTLMDTESLGWHDRMSRMYPRGY